MKQFHASILVTALTTLCLILIIAPVVDFSHPVNANIGPNDTYAIGIGSTISDRSDSLLTFKSSAYFELSQSGTTIQSVKEPPQIGENKGNYWIRDFNLSGDWKILHAAPTVYNPAAISSLTVKPGLIEITFFGLMITLLSIVIWILGMVAIRIAFK